MIVKPLYINILCYTKETYCALFFIYTHIGYIGLHVSFQLWISTLWLFLSEIRSRCPGALWEGSTLSYTRADYIPLCLLSGIHDHWEYRTERCTRRVVLHVPGILRPTHRGRLRHSDVISRHIYRKYVQSIINLKKLYDRYFVLVQKI